MSDIVERLRDRKIPLLSGKDRNVAADEIDRLRAAATQARDAGLEEAAKSHDDAATEYDAKMEMADRYDADARWHAFRDRRDVHRSSAVRIRALKSTPAREGD